MPKKLTCCRKCNLSDCQHYIDMANSQDALCLLDQTFMELFKWYDRQPAAWKKKANPKLWAETRRDWKGCT